MCFSACNNTSKQPNKFTKNTIAIPAKDTSVTGSFIYKEEQRYFHIKNALCNSLALYDIEKTSGNFELRLWFFNSIWSPNDLYILKKIDSVWTVFNYRLYVHYLPRTNNTDYNNPVIDSVMMESVRPQKINWQSYIKNLQLDSLWNLQTESSMKGQDFGITDGYRCLLELSDKERYKYLFYTEPEYFQKKEINHKKFIEFENHLIQPILSKRMHFK
jgi:hypothetical protein